MASRPPDGVPLRHVPDNRGYRLIELPPELQALLESDNPPVLTLEASDTSALLKTPDHTYALRQKNTSNSVVLLALRSPPGDQSPAAEWQAISTIKETVELDNVGQAVRVGVGAKGKWHQRFASSR